MVRPFRVSRQFGLWLKGATAQVCLFHPASVISLGFTAFGLAMIPYIGWNYWFSGIGPARGMVNSLMWLDFRGNVFFHGRVALVCKGAR